MGDLRRLYVEPGELPGDAAVISGPEAHHALNVLRMKPGERVLLFDGAGLEGAGAIGMTTRKDLVIEIEECHRAAPLPYEVILLQAWIHRDKALEDLIRRGTEVGVNRFVFFAAQRSERQPKASDKWQRWAIDACKQCGRAWLPEFVCVKGLEEALHHAKGSVCLLTLSESNPTPLRNAVNGGDVTLLVGPEGDFTPEEEAAARAVGATPVSLGATVYRAEVASVLAAALVHYEQGGMGPRPS